LPEHCSQTHDQHRTTYCEICRSLRGSVTQPTRMPSLPCGYVFRSRIAGKTCTSMLQRSWLRKQSIAMHPCSHCGDNVKVHAIVSGVQHLYSVRAMADETCSSIDEAVTGEAVVYYADLPGCVGFWFRDDMHLRLVYWDMAHPFCVTLLGRLGGENSIVCSCCSTQCSCSCSSVSVWCGCPYGPPCCACCI
jgi:hypothetical protein